MKIRGVMISGIAVMTGLFCGLQAGLGQSRHHSSSLIDAPDAPATGPSSRPSSRPAPHPIPPGPTPKPPKPGPPVPAPPPTPAPPLPGPVPESHGVGQAGAPLPVMPDWPKRPVATVSIPKQTRVNLAWQIALESMDFSPGVLDGHFQRKSLMALREYEGRYFPGAPLYDPKVFASLDIDAEGAVTTYQITDDDAAQVGGALPEDWNAKAKLDRLRYESLADCLTEKFHCTRGLFETLNPGVRMDSLEPGQTINVPNLRPFPADDKPTVVKRAGQSGEVVVNLAEKTIRVMDKEGRELALFHCSIARDKAKLPEHDTSIKAIAAPNPEYTFYPENWPEVHNVSSILTIHPGPRNPVGLAWVSLELKGYGIHGTPKPELIGKTGSHGCFRLTNWDALKFAGLVEVGMVVRIVNAEK